MGVAPGHVILQIKGDELIQDIGESPSYVGELAVGEPVMRWRNDTTSTDRYIEEGNMMEAP